MQNLIVLTLGIGLLNVPVGIYSAVATGVILLTVNDREELVQRLIKRYDEE